MIDVSENIPLYHWSPRVRRGGIRKYGLVPGKLSRDGEWRPPRVCLALTPSMAWSSLRYSVGVEGFGADAWDLWQTWTDRLKKPFERMEFGSIVEYRVYERIYKRDIWWVGERSV